MKKLQTGIVATALLAAIGVTSAFAAGPGWGWRAGQDAVRPACTGAFCRYTDADGDGVCDVCGRYDAGVGGNGVGLGNGTGRRYYTDENGDGVCDRYAAGAYIGYGRGACSVYGR